MGAVPARLAIRDRFLSRLDRHAALAAGAIWAVWLGAVLAVVILGVEVGAISDPHHNWPHFGGPLECAALALAGWARYLATVPTAERAHDPHGDLAATFAVRSLADPRAFLEFDAVFTPRLRESDRFGKAFAAATRELAARGSVGALDQLLGDY